MLRYENLTRRPLQLLALTGLARREFEELLPAFDQAYRAHYPIVKKKGQRAAGGGRKAPLPTREDQLLFILVYQKTYPLQVVMAELFRFSQPSANYWIHQLLPVLLGALDTLKVLPERNGERLADHERRQPEPHDWVIDGTEHPANGRKTLKNRRFITVVRRKPIATRISSSSTRPASGWRS